MKINKFDVVELKNKNRAVILNKEKEKSYLAEIIDNNGNTILKGIIKNDEIDKIIYKKKKKGKFHF